MNVIKVLKDEHDAVRVELSELDFIMDGDEINYPNLVHTFWKLCKIWDSHEKMEEELFVVMKKEGFDIPTEIILPEHKSLRGRIKGIEDAISSNKESEVKKVFTKEMKELVNILRKHMIGEEAVFEKLLIVNLSDEGKERIRQIVLKRKG